MLVTVTVFILAAGTGTASSCPHFCKCLWRASKITVDCSGLLHTAIPDLVSSDTQVLNMSRTSLTGLPSRVFFIHNLTNIQRLHITQSSLAYIDDNAFSGLLNLLEIDLSANKLDKIPSSSFPCSPQLTTLSLRDNPIHSVPKSSFSSLSHLVKVDLSGCRIAHLEPGAFSGLSRLERLYLSDNLLAGVQRVEDTLPVVHGLTLHGNPWTCDCKAKTFRLWLEHTALPSLAQLACSAPPLVSGRLIRSLPLSSLACAPRVSPGSMGLSVTEGRHVSLTCNVEADPLPALTWTFDNNPLDKFSYRKDDLAVEKQIISQGVVRSILSISGASPVWNGTFSCVARNVAGVVRANYSLTVIRTGEVGRVLDLKLEYFIVLTVSVLCMFVISVLCIVLVCAVIARRTLLPLPPPPGKEPAPDLISDVICELYKPRQPALHSDTSTYSLDTATTATLGPGPVSVWGSTLGILQPSGPRSGYTCSRPLSSEWRHMARSASPRPGPGMRREWRSVDTFLSVQPSYPSDWGLPRIALTCPGPPITRLGSGDDSRHLERLKKAEHSHPQKEHEYSQIQSLTVLGLDHHYESLPSLINPGPSLGQPAAPLSAASQGISNNPCGENTGENVTLYKKFFSLPLLDDFLGASEI